MVNIMEAVSLISLSVSFLIFAYSVPKMKSLRLFSTALIFPLITGIATVAEDFVLPDILNTIEHVSWLIGAAVFLIAAIKFKENV